MLVLDDSQDTADSLGFLLSLWGHEPVIAYGGQTAVELALIYRPHVALLDLSLPYLDGYEVAARLRATAGLEGMLLIAITGLIQEEARRRTSALGFAHHFTKPVDPDELRSLLAGVEVLRPELSTRVRELRRPPLVKYRYRVHQQWDFQSRP